MNKKSTETLFAPNATNQGYSRGNLKANFPRTGAAQVKKVGARGSKRAFPITGGPRGSYAKLSGKQKLPLRKQQKAR